MNFEEITLRAIYSALVDAGHEATLQVEDHTPNIKVQHTKLGHIRVYVDFIQKDRIAIDYWSQMDTRDSDIIRLANPRYIDEILECLSDR